MYARCNFLQGDPSTIDGFVGFIRERVVPTGTPQGGFRGVLSLVDRDSGKSLTITLWDSEEARAASAEQAERIRSDATQDLGGEVVAVEDYELVIDERFD